MVILEEYIKVQTEMRMACYIEGYNVENYIEYIGTPSCKEEVYIQYCLDNYQDKNHDLTTEDSYKFKEQFNIMNNE